MRVSDRETAIERLRELQKSVDPEQAHSDADAVLCELLIALGYIDVVREWGEVERWYA